MQSVKREAMKKITVKNWDEAVLRRALPCALPRALPCFALSIYFLFTFDGLQIQIGTLLCLHFVLHAKNFSSSCSHGTSIIFYGHTKQLQISSTIIIYIIMGILM